MYLSAPEHVPVQDKKKKRRRDCPKGLLLVEVIPRENFDILHCMKREDYEEIAMMLAEPTEMVKAKFALANTGMSQVLKRERCDVLREIVPFLLERICTCAFKLSIHDE